MKNFAKKVQNLGQKAAQVREAIQGAPAKVMEIREAVTAAAGQLHQLRADVQSSVHGLRTEGDDHLTLALREVDASHELLGQAGYAVVEVEMELGLAQRLIVHLEKVEDVPHATIRSLLSAQDSRRTLHAILAALLKAEELADKVNLSHLTYHKLTVYAGLTPSVRLCWGAEQVETVPAAHTTTAAMNPAPPPLPAPSAFTQSSYFERAAPVAPTPAAAASAPVPVSAVAATPAPSASLPEPERPHGDFGHSALERFKKMPDLSKYRR